MSKNTASVSKEWKMIKWPEKKETAKRLAAVIAGIAVVALLTFGFDVMTKALIAAGM